MNMKAYIWAREVVLDDRILHWKRELDLSDVEAWYPDPWEIEASYGERIREDNQYREWGGERQDLEVCNQHNRHVGHLAEDPESVWISVFHAESAFEEGNSDEKDLPEDCDRERVDARVDDPEDVSLGVEQQT